MLCVTHLFGAIIVMCNMSIIIVFIIMYIYYLTVYMFCISCYGTNKLLLCDFCTFVQINSIGLKIKLIFSLIMNEIMSEMLN